MDPLKNIIFISIPENFEQNIGDFKIDSSVLLPVETGQEESKWDINSLSWEMIIAGMLKVLAYNPEHNNNEYYKKFIFATKPDIIAEFTKIGILKAQNKDFDIAEEIFAALVNLDPENINTISNLALVYEEHAEVYKQLDKAKYLEEYLELCFKTYKRALHFFPESTVILLNAGHFFLSNSNFIKAEECFEKYVKLSDDKKTIKETQAILNNIQNLKTHDDLFKAAFDYIKMGKEEEGIKKIELFLEKNPKTWNAWFLLGWANRKLSNFKEAKEAFQKSINLDDQQVDSFNELAICEMELANFKESRTALNTAFKMDSENLKIISNMGILSMKEGNIEESISFFKTVLEISPEDPIALNYLEILKKK